MAGNRKGNGKMHESVGDTKFEEITKAFEEAKDRDDFLPDNWNNPPALIPGPGELALGIFYDPDRYKGKGY